MSSFHHVSVLLDASIDALNIRPDGIYVDGTLGGGGHSREIASRLTTGHLIGIDRDETALAAAGERLAPFMDRVTLVHSNFCEMDSVIRSLGYPGVDGVLLDLGSHVLDLITWLCGYPEAVFCAQRTLYDTRPTREGGATRDLSDDQTLMLLRLPGGAMGQVEASKIATGANDELTVEIRGEKGARAFDLMQPNYLRFYDNTRPEAPLGGERGFQWIETGARYPAPGGTFLPPKNSIGWDRGHLHCYYTFLDCLARGAAPDNGVGEGARLQMLMERAAQSAAQGRWVDTGDL